MRDNFERCDDSLSIGVIRSAIYNVNKCCCSVPVVVNEVR